MLWELARKEKDVQEAVKLVEPRMTLVLNDGSTTRQLLSEKRQLTVVSNNATVIGILVESHVVNFLALDIFYSVKYNVV